NRINLSGGNIVPCITDHTGGAGLEVTGNAISAITERVHGIQDTLPGYSANLCAVVKHIGDSRRRDSGCVGNIADCDGQFVTEFDGSVDYLLASFVVNKGSVAKRLICGGHWYLRRSSDIF